jgi:hypothetical protein
MRRALAFVVAAGMIAGSLVVRDRIDEHNARKRTVLRLACVTELEDVCDGLAGSRDVRVTVVVEPAGTTADRLSKAKVADLDGWLVTPPWPEAVDAARQRAGLTKLFAPSGAPVARSPLVLLVQRPREQVLRASCGNAIGWKCVGEAAPKRWSDIGGMQAWGPVKPWHPDPRDEAVGLLVAGQATAAYLGRTDVSTVDLDDPAYLDWLSGLELAVRRTRGSVTDMLTAPAQVDVVGTTEADAGPQIASAEVTEKPVVLYPRPVATADLLLAPLAGSRVTAVLRSLVGGEGRRALAKAGWRVEGQDLARGVLASVPLPARSGLPSPGLLAALRASLTEIR